MTPADYTAWRTRLRLTKAAAAEALGASRNACTHYEQGRASIPRHIALACSAVAMGLPPYGTTPQEPEARKA